MIIQTENFEAKLNELLMRMGIPLQVVWRPDPNSEQHAKIDLKNGLLLIFDEDKDQAFFSFMHEILEYRINRLFAPYRKMINSLIELIEQLIYKEKEIVVEQILSDFEVLAREGLL